MANNIIENPFVDENGGLCDETLKIFREFMAMVTVTSMHPEIDLECSICMNILFMPCELEFCYHVFCAVCIFRLIQARGPNCPLCRAPFQYSYPLCDLGESIKKYYEDDYQERLNVEEESGIFNEVFEGIDEMTLREEYRIQKTMARQLISHFLPKYYYYHH